MSEFLLYGKRTGLPDKNGNPVFDKTFRALDAWGVRVNKLSDAMSYATKEDALEVLQSDIIQKNIKEGLVEFDVRRG